jgi:hypothetical protein
MLSPDGLSITFVALRQRVATIHRATRANVAAAFGTPEPLVLPIEESYYWPYTDSDGFLYFARETRADIAYAKPLAQGGFETPTRLSELSSVGFEACPVLSPDALTVFFCRPVGTEERYDVFTARRADKSQPFETPVPVDAVNTESNDWPTWISPDGCVLHVTSNAGGAYRLYEARRPL